MLHRCAKRCNLVEIDSASLSENFQFPSFFMYPACDFGEAIYVCGIFHTLWSKTVIKIIWLSTAMNTDVNTNGKRDRDTHINSDLNRITYC